MRRAIFILILSVLSLTRIHSQFSLATDFNLQRSFKENQRYWAVGQTVYLHYQLSHRNGAFGSFVYYSNGRFENELQATAKGPITTPQQITYISRTKMSFKEIVFGWKHYFAGSASDEHGLNLYSLLGLGLIFGHVENLHSMPIDTSVYYVPVLQGNRNFKRLTLDLGAGVEIPLGAEIYLYTELKAPIPITYFPSRYLLVSKYAPLTTSLSLGFRIFFD